MILYGVLKIIYQDGADGNTRKTKLANGYDNNHLMIVGDRISKICAKIFSELKEEISYFFGCQNEATLMIYKALK